MWSPRRRALPAALEAACATHGLESRAAESPDAVIDTARRSRPALVLVDGSETEADTRQARALVAALKADAYTSLTPVLVLAGGDTEAAGWLDLGADDVLSFGDEVTGAARLTAALRRSARDLAAQPTTRLPAASAIDAEIARRIADGDAFAACYADLDHFKEFNDRYGFREGDRVIRMVARVLYDAALGLGGPGSFVGHIGGDDFMLVLALDRAAPVCELAIDVFDTLAPLQYSEADRRAGYYFGKDRRGQLHRVPLLTLSIGAVTTERRQLRTPAEVSRLASEMKSFAKARPGSVFAVDRRADGDPTAARAGTTPRGAHTP